MKNYRGSRSMDGIVVTVDGERLPQYSEVKCYTRLGFDWTYEGVNPRQLALAILFDHTGDKERAIGLSGPFMKDIVANFDNDWTLTGSEVEAAIKSIEARVSGGAVGAP